MVKGQRSKVKGQQFLSNFLSSPQVAGFPLSRGMKQVFLFVWGSHLPHFSVSFFHLHGASSRGGGTSISCESSAKQRKTTQNNNISCSAGGKRCIDHEWNIEGCRLLMVVIDGHWRSSIGSDSHRWTLTVIDSHRWTLTVIDSHRWLSMAIGCHR